MIEKDKFTEEARGLVDEIWNSGQSGKYTQEAEVERAKQRWTEYLKNQILGLKEQMDIDTSIGHHVRKIVELIK